VVSASIEVSELVEVAAPPDRVWALITDPRVVVESVPGATLVAERADGTLEGTLAVKLGPTRVEFGGEAVPEFDPVLRQGTLVAEGADKGGRSRARATTTFRVEEATAGGSIIVINGTIELAGGLSGFLQTGGVHLARRMMKDFGDQLASRLERTASPVAEPRAVNGFRLLALTVLDGARAFMARVGRWLGREERKA
jgi:uncharacterized protein